MPDRVRITDVSPRDGLQNEPGVIPTADKVRLVELLSQTGVDEVEVTSFVSPKWVPQLGDAEQVFAGLLRLGSSLRSPSLREGLGVGSPIAPSAEDGRGLAAPARNRRTMGQARALRRDMTGPELALWAHLRNAAWMGTKFRRQHPFGPYILDFFSVDKMLCVEVDGQTHARDGAKARDAEREEYLQKFGVTVMRVWNDRVIENAEGVAAAIRSAASELRARSANQPTPRPPPSGRGSNAPLLLSALVPNERGVQAALDINKQAGRRIIDKVSVFTAASETFSLRNTNATIAQTLERFLPVVAAAKANGLTVRGYVSCVIACPFEGPTPPAAVAGVSARLRDIGIDELDLGDTIGAGTPGSLSSMLAAVDKVWSTRNQPPPSERGLLTLHLHDTFGRAADCVRAALDLGIRSFDGSVAGLGGCPYASTPGKRAPGNISTELLVRTVEDAGYDTGVNRDKLAQAAAFASSIVAKSRGAP